MSPWPTPTSIPSTILIHSARWSQVTWAEKRGAVVPFREDCVPIYHYVAGAEAYQVTSRSIQPFVHNRHKPKIGGCCAPFLRELGPHLTQCDHGRGLPPYQVAFLLDPSSRLATIYVGPKMGVAAVPLRAV